MKLKNKLCLILGSIIIVSVPTIALSACKTYSNNNDNDDSNSPDDDNSNNSDDPNYIDLFDRNLESDGYDNLVVNPVPESIDTVLDSEQIINNDVFSIGTINSRTISVQKRIRQNQYYDSEAYRKYHNTYDFRYPGQDFNYEGNGNKNAIFENKDNPSDTINGFDVVMDERVTNEHNQYVNANNEVVTEENQKIKYNNPDWILNEIKRGTLKKHRAADKMFLNDISKIHAITKEFSISTSTKGDLTLGLYIPAGEVVEITFTDETWELIKDRKNAISFVINQNMWDNRAKNDSGKISTRYPYIESRFNGNTITEKTFKIGSPFGGGLSIFINSTITKDGDIPLYSQVQDVSFSVSGAIPCLYYEDGITKEEEWFNQIKKVQQNELAPILQAWSPYFSLTIPFNGLNRIGGKDINTLIYPDKAFKKWNEFLFLSNYLAGRDLSNNLTRLNMEFCDDIWGGAAAWGGGMTFYCPTSWGNLIFGSEPINVFNAGNSWGVFHEINHNFQQDAAFFRKRGHGETNQVTAFNLSIVSDITRFRNEINYTGENVSNNYNNGWCYLDTPYSIMKKLHRQNLNSADEYPIYSILLFFMGSKNYAEYVRKDVREHPSGASDWTGISEIGRISDTFKLNMWPAFKDYSQYWSNWSTSYEDASESDKRIIDRIQSYKAVDFVANQYACGSYLYNSETDEYTYTNDILPAFEIPPNSSYTLDFESMITSTNKNFNFNAIEFEASTKLGGTLKLDSTNNKKLIYTPPTNNFAEIDEFDISIIPGEWENKPSNYVDKYKFKIKLRPEVNSAIVETFEPLGNNSNPEAYFNKLETLTPKYAPATKIPTLYFEDDQKRGIKIKYRFVAPKDGTYVFKNKYDDYIKIFANNQLVFNENHDVQNFKQTYTKDLKQGETINFENIVINTGGPGGFSLQIFCNDEEISVMDNIISPYINLENNNYLDLLSNPKYKYKSREINREIFNKSLTATNNLSTYSLMDTIIDPKKYTLSGHNKVQNLNSFNNDIVEIWGSGTNPTTLELTFDFVEPQYLTSIFVGGRTNNWTNARPTKITVTGYESDTSNDEIIIHDGDYGIEFNDRLSSISKMNFSNPQTVKRAKIKLINDKPVSGNQTALSLKWVRLSNKKFFNISNQFGFNDQLMNISKGWVFRRNDELNSSALNNIYACSNQSNNRISFTLNNCSGFSIVGQLSNKNPTTFDIYINDVLQTVSYDKNDKLIYNDALFTYKTNSLQKIKVEIVSKTSDPLYLNYVMTFGEGVYLS